MKLGDEVFKGKAIFGDTKVRGIIFDSLEQIDRPAASDIVGNLDCFDPLIFHRGKEYVVHVNEPN